MKIIYTLMLILAASQLKAEFCLSQIRSDVDAADMFCMSNRWDYSMLQDAMNFEGVGADPTYAGFASSISNCWREVLANFEAIATNNLERLLVLGVGKQYGEDFYIDYMGVLSDLRTNGTITAKEFSWARASTRFDLQSCLFRRYQEPKVIELIDKYKAAMPGRTNYWDSVLSGAAYTNYLEEVEAGLWQ